MLPRILEPALTTVSRVGASHLIQKYLCAGLNSYTKVAHAEPRLTGRYLLCWMVFRNAQALNFCINTTEVIKNININCLLRDASVASCDYFFLKICHSQELIHARTAFWPKQYRSIPTNVLF